MVSWKNAVDIISVWGNKEIGKREVIVAVIDTGVDYNHDALKNYMWHNTNEIANDGVDNDKNGYVDDIMGWNFVEDMNEVLTGDVYYENDHGTECASIISAGASNSKFRGINYNENIKIMTLKVLSGIEKRGEVANIIEAIKYAENNGADICNLSANFTDYNDELSQVIKQSDMLFVVSAGNNARDIDKNSVYLASYEYQNIISVAAVDRQGQLYDESNYGKHNVDIAAPGVDIYCAVVNGYDYDTGTSMATAIVSGVCAMAMSTNEINSIYDLKELMIKNSSEKASLENVVLSGGIVNASNIIDKVKNRK